MEKGLKFTRNDGTFDWYDPVEIDDIIESEESYTFSNGGSRIYEVLKSDVKALEYYELCMLCGYGIDEDGYCTKYECENFE